MQLLPACLAAVVLGALAPAAHAQGRIVVLDEFEIGEGFVFDAGQEPGVEGAEQAAAPAAPTPRLQALQRLEYDRRPSTILAAWSTPPKPPGEADAAGASAPGTGAAPDASAPGAPTDPALAPAGGRLALTTSTLVSGTAIAVQPGGAISIAAVPATPVAPAPAPGAAPATAAGAAPTVVSGAPLAPSSGAASAPALVAPSAAPGSPAPGSSVPGAAPAPAATGQPAGAAVASAEPPANETAEQKAAREAAAKAAEEAARAAREAAAKQAAETKAIAAEMTALQRNVTLGDWAAVRAYYATLTEAEAKGGYERMLQSLQQGPQQRPQVPQQGQPYLERNQFAPEDVLGLALVPPKPPEKKQVAILGAFLRQALDAGHQLETFLAGLTPRLEDPASGVTRRLVATLLVGANEPRALATLLPPREEAERQDDREGLNLIARWCLAEHAKDSKPKWLEEAWRATQSVLAVGKVDDETKGEALTRAVEIAPRIQKELGQAWLDESFTARPERGMEILAAIGSAASLSLAAAPLEREKREKLLELQTTATKALLAAAPERARSWSKELELLAGNWLREALVSYAYDESTSMSPRRQRDFYGNFYYFSGGSSRGNVPAAISTAKVLEIRPSDAWLGHVDPTLAPRFRILFAQLYLKLGEEALAFPYIEALAAELPRQGKELADEFLRVWTKNHDPNSERNRTNDYMFFYGFEERASGIPLTRSKQERNLQELAEWVARLRKLPVELDDTLVAAAFTTAHSSAEVFRLESIERIFGPVAELEPSTIAQILQTMRGNLVETWRDPALQEKNKTNRRQKEIQTEILRGYALGVATVDSLLADHADSWELWVVKAALLHDENNFRAEIAKDAEFSARRAAAFDGFRKAAELYAAQVPELEREKESTAAYDMWFYAALGACDLGAIDAKKLLADAQIDRIRDALRALPGEAAERHVAMFAGALFARMSNVAPAIKFRYVREGLEIAGDHKLAHEARQVFDYYSDLVTEIQLRATIDGSDRVGHAAPFGLAIDIRHTREIEREAGGFSKYLQNQNNQSFGYNYGRPLEDYRDKFEETLREGLSEHFKVLSVTFNEPTARSKADPEYGWRVTPYAYALLEPRNEAVDRIPPIRLDLDFLDTSGYAILPVETPAVVIDARTSEPRPFEGLALTQTLDERQADKGKLLLEVKATARGLVPELASVIDLAPPGFEVASLDDRGVSVVKFAEEASGVESERTWTVTLRAKDGTRPPETFAFGKPRDAAAKSEHFRYVDADLATVGPTVPLESRYAKPGRGWLWWIPAGLLAIVAGVVAWRISRRPRVEAEARFRVPQSVNAFTVLGLLRDIQDNDGLASDEHRALASDIDIVERHYFGGDGAAAPDLAGIAHTWVSRTSLGTGPRSGSGTAPRARRGRAGAG